MKLIIGNKNYSSWSLRGWLGVRQSGLPFDEEVVSLYDHDWEQRRTADAFAPSAGKVPILWDGDDCAVWDSLAIIDYLDGKTGGTRGFWPDAPPARAMARSMAAEMHAGFAALRRTHGMNIRRHYPAQPLSAEVEDDVARIVQLWAQARARFGGTGEFLFGDWSAVDMMFAPVVSRFITYSIPIPRFAQGYCHAVINQPHMQEWIGAARAEDWVIDKFEGAAQR